MKKILIILLTVFLTILLFSCSTKQSKIATHSYKSTQNIQTNENINVKKSYYNENKLFDFDYNFDNKSDKPLYFALKFLKIIIILGI